MGIKIKKDYFLRKKFIKGYLSKELLKSFINNPRLSIEERQYLKLKFDIKYKHFYSIVRLRNHCLFTQNTRSVYKNVKLSRHFFKKMALNGNLPG